MELIPINNVYDSDLQDAVIARDQALTIEFFPTANPAYLNFTDPQYKFSSDWTVEFFLKYNIATFNQTLINETLRN